MFSSAMDANALEANAGESHNLHVLHCMRVLVNVKILTSKGTHAYTAAHSHAQMIQRLEDRRYACRNGTLSCAKT